MNRYSQITTSEFNPLSFQEIMAAPLAMRQKHDNAIAAAEALRIKANPLDKHLARAVELKQQMDNEISNNVDTLNKEGYNPTTFQNIIKLNRQYQDMISPTGEIGQINNAKIVYDKAQEDFIQDAAKQNIGRDRAINLWKEKTAYYTGFGEDGKSITNVSPQGVAAYQDYEKYKQVAKSLMGEVESESRSGGYKLKDSGLGNGSMVMVDSKGFQKKSTNLDALNNAIIAGNEMWLKPTGEGYKYNQDAGVDQNNFKQRFIGDFGSMLRTSRGSGYEENGQFINDATGPNGGGGSNKGSMFNDAIQDPNSIKNLNKDTGEIDFKQIGSNKPPSAAGSFAQSHSGKQNTDSSYVEKVGIQTYKDVLSPIQQKFYETAAKRLIASGRLPKNADLNSTANAEKIGFYMKNHMKFPTVATDIIRADVAIDNQLFSGNLASKDQNSRNATLTQDLRQTKDGKPLRTMLDVESGGKVKLEEGDTIDYLGVESPINYSSYGFENKNEQSVMGHRAQVLDSKGNVKANVVISRTPNEMKDPTFKKMYEISHIYKNGLNKLGEWIRPTGNYSGSKELAKTKVKVNDDNTFQIQIDGYGESPKMNNEQFIQQMQSIMEY
jgi:hypothetical protein